MPSLNPPSFNYFNGHVPTLAGQNNPQLQQISENVNTYRRLVENYIQKLEEFGQSHNSGQISAYSTSTGPLISTRPLDVGRAQHHSNNSFDLGKQTPTEQLPANGMPPS